MTAVTGNVTATLKWTHRYSQERSAIWLPPGSFLYNDNPLHSWIPHSGDCSHYCCPLHSCLQSPHCWIPHLGVPYNGEFMKIPHISSASIFFTLVFPTLLCSSYLFFAYSCIPHTGVSPTVVSSLNWFYFHTSFAHTRVSTFVLPL